MTGKDALKVQYSVMYQIVARNLDGITAEHSVVQPEPAGNCVNWILAHMTLVQNAILAMLGEAPAWDEPTLERARSEPVAGAGGAYDWEAMRGRFLDSRDRMLPALDRLDDDRLDEPMVDIFGKPNTLGGVLNFLALHQNYHAGQLGLARRLIGLEGVIRAPESRPGKTGAGTGSNVRPA